MNFKEFRNLLHDNITHLIESEDYLFEVDVDKDTLWELYTNSFPKGTNEVFRERPVHDCSTCKSFIQHFGNVVVIKDLEIKTIWDFPIDDDTYFPVVKAIADKVKNSTIRDVFVSQDRHFGYKQDTEFCEDEKTITWNHLYYTIPEKYRNKSRTSDATIRGKYRDSRNVFKRSLEEISKDSVETVLDLIAQKSLYKGEEWQGVLDTFLNCYIEYHKLNDKEKDAYTWETSLIIENAISKIKNHSIGVLLTDISEGMDLDRAVSRYEQIVAPSNYKRPKAIFTKKMIEQAEKKLNELGLIDSLSRRYATLEDITINNILFANKDSTKKISGSVFDEMREEVTVKPKNFDRVEEVPIETFVSDILPNVEEIDLLLENKHQSNFMSVIAPKVKDSKTMLKWDNNFSWAYTGNITDSMKERVKSAGGKVDGVIRFSLQWNEDGDNENDFDAHCIEPEGNQIYYGNKINKDTSGELDVDIIDPNGKVAIENITWSNIHTMQEGVYHFRVHNYSHRGGRSGFRAEIEYDGQIYSYDYPHDIKHKDSVTVAKIKFSKDKGIEFIKSLDSTIQSKNVWGLQTNSFHPVSVMMYSPNYWDEQRGIGHKHYFFILKDCKNEESPNGFFNEYLNEGLMEHKRVFEALGSKMKVESSDNQLSGLGFSSTKHNEVVCKVKGSFTRTIKIIF